MIFSFQYIRLAYRALRANAGRSLLTTLGIVIGIVTLILVFALGQGTQAIVEAELTAYGSNTIFVEIKVPGFGDTNPAGATAMVEGVTITTLKEEDMEATLQIPGVVDAYAGQFSQERVISIYADQKYLIQGTSAAFVDIDQADVEFGRFFTADEDRSLARVAVIGHSVAEELFPGVDPLGQTVRIKGVNFKVIGVMEELGIVFTQNLDEQVWIPVNTMQKLILGIDHLVYYVVEVENESIAPSVKEDIIAILDQRHDIKKEESRDFHVTTMQEAIELLSIVTGALQLLLIILALIALVVGGVGVMNVMFVVVSERTREIGLRKAVGATRGVIMIQFLWEALMITSFGGVVGIVLGVGLVYFAVWVAGLLGVGIGFFVPVSGILFAVAAALVEGLVFGLYPAQKAASLNPIESLRYE